MTSPLKRALRNVFRWLPLKRKSRLRVREKRRAHLEVLQCLLPLEAEISNVRDAASTFSHTFSLKSHLFQTAITTISLRKIQLRDGLRSCGRRFTRGVEQGRVLNVRSLLFSGRVGFPHFLFHLWYFEVPQCR